MTTVNILMIFYIIVIAALIIFLRKLSVDPNQIRVTANVPTARKVFRVVNILLIFDLILSIISIFVSQKYFSLTCVLIGAFVSAFSALYVSKNIIK